MKHIDELCDQGTALFENQDFEEALAVFQQAIALDPNSVEAHNGIGACLLQSGDIDSALKELNEATRLDPENWKPYLNRASALMVMQDPTQAMDEIDRAIELGADAAPVFLQRGNWYLAQKRYDEAIEDLSQVLSIHPENSTAYACRGVAYYHLDAMEDALNDFDRAIEIDDETPWFYGWRGYVHDYFDEFEAAIDDYDSVLNLEPDNANCYRYRGEAYLELDEIEAAISDFDKSLALEPNDARAFYYRGEAWLELNDFQRSLEDLSQAIKCDEEYRPAFRLRSKVWDLMGQHEKAEVDFKRAEELNNPQTDDEDHMPNKKETVYQLIKSYFEQTTLNELAILERRFPSRVRADLQIAIEKFISEEVDLRSFSGVRKRYNHEGINFSELITLDRDDPAITSPPQYEEVDIGEDKRVKCLTDGLWLAEFDGQKFVLFLEPPSHHGRMSGLRFQIAVANTEAGNGTCEKVFAMLESAVLESTCYRGKILSLERGDHYSGVSTAIKVHKLKSISRDDVILPAKTLELLERNVINFVEHRNHLKSLGISTRKGLLFYGPPGTGKTHTIQYLAKTLAQHTTLLISAEQVGLLQEYMTLARLLQPSIVVLEDVDLIARDRRTMTGGCDEILLNKLLNEMDGLQPDADIMFILTTNRPETLEAALASRPGRVDQSIEFPIPDEEGRRKLIQLYSFDVNLGDDLVSTIVQKTKNVSAAFIKELMRRSIQFQLERDANQIELEDVENAIEELLFSGGSLNRKLLGAVSEDD